MNARTSKTETARRPSISGRIAQPSRVVLSTVRSALERVDDIAINRDGNAGNEGRLAIAAADCGRNETVSDRLNPPRAVDSVTISVYAI